MVKVREDLTDRIFGKLKLVKKQRINTLVNGLMITARK